MTAQGPIRGRMPILLSLSAAGRSNPGNPGLLDLAVDRKRHPMGKLREKPTAWLKPSTLPAVPGRDGRSDRPS